MKQGSGKEETFLDVQILLGRNLEIRGRSLRNELPLASVDVKLLTLATAQCLSFSLPFQSSADLAGIGFLRFICAGCVFGVQALAGGLVKVRLCFIERLCLSNPVPVSFGEELNELEGMWVSKGRGVAW